MLVITTGSHTIKILSLGCLTEKEALHFPLISGHLKKEMY